jgi:uncharacterized protein YtpQ (UPF0354 family)
MASLMPSLPNTEAVTELSKLDSPIILDLKNGLLVGYLVDAGEHFQYVQGRHLEAEGITIAALHHGAIMNLAALLTEKGANVQPYGDIFAVLFGGNFEASLLLIDAFWDKFLSNLAPNGFVVAIPNRDILAFCDAQSEPGIDQLRQLIQRVEGGDHPITPNLYRRDQSTRTWRPYAN